MNRLALWTAEKLLAFVGKGEHTYVYASRVKDIRDEINEMRAIYFGARRSVSVVLNSCETVQERT